MQCKQVSVASISENYPFYKNLVGDKPATLKWDSAVFINDEFQIELLESSSKDTDLFVLEVSKKNLVQSFKRMSRFVKPVSFGDSCKPLEDHFALKDPHGNQLLIKTSAFKGSLTKVEDCYLETFEN